MKKLLSPLYNKAIPSLSREMVNLHISAGEDFKFNSAKHELFGMGLKGLTDEQKLAKLQLAILQSVLLYNSLKAKHDAINDTQPTGTGSNNPRGRSKKATFS